MSCGSLAFGLILSVFNADVTEASTTTVAPTTTTTHSPTSTITATQHTSASASNASQPSASHESAASASAPSPSEASKFGGVVCWTENDGDINSWNPGHLSKKVNYIEANQGEKSGLCCAGNNVDMKDLSAACTDVRGHKNHVASVSYKDNITLSGSNIDVPINCGNCL